MCAACFCYHPRGNVRGHNYRQLTRLDRRVTGNNNSSKGNTSSSSRRHHHHRRIWHSLCALRTVRATQRRHGRNVRSTGTFANTEAASDSYRSTNSFVISSLHHIHCVLVSWKRCSPRLSLSSCSSLCSGPYFLSRPCSYLQHHGVLHTPLNCCSFHACLSRCQIHTPSPLAGGLLFLVSFPHIPYFRWYIFHVTRVILCKLS